MSQDLIARLRAKPCATINPPTIELEAADRIEALTAALEDCVNRMRLMIRRDQHKLLDVTVYDAARAVLGNDKPVGQGRPINLNERFAVTLTEDGARVYNEAYAELRRDYPQAGFPVVQPGEQLRKSLWGLMEVFGPRVYMGMHPHFELNEIVPIER